MMKTYEVRHGYIWSEQLLIIGLIVVVSLSEWLGLLTFGKRVVEWGMRPIMVASTRFVSFTSYPFTQFNQAWSAQQKLNLLELQLADLSVKAGALEALQRENQALKELLNVKNTEHTEVRIAVPLTSLSDPAIAAGEADGIKPGQMVQVSQILVGVISEVSQHQSQVDLLLSPDVMPVLAQTSSGVQGLVKGDGQNVVLTELPLDASVQLGEVITTVGQPGIKPGVVIGRVANVETRPTSPVQTMSLDQGISFYRAHLVEVQ